jgi:uncharacterized protein (TIRG00374 family)
VISPRILHYARFVLAAAVLGFLAHVVDWAQIGRAASEADPWWILPAVLLMPLNLFLEGYRWHRLVRRIAPRVRLRESLGAMMAGYPLGFATPGRIGDYVGRAYYLRYHNKWALAALTFAERAMTLACCVVFGLAALLYFLVTRTELATPAWMVVFYVGALAASALLGLLLYPRAAHALLMAVTPSRRIRRMLRFLKRYSSRDAYELFGLSAVRYAVFSTQFACLVLAFDPGVSWLTAYVGVALVFFAKSAIPSFTVADLGIREGAAVYFFDAMGADVAAAFNASFLVFCLNILLPAIIGLPFVLRLRLAPPEAAEEPAAVPLLEPVPVEEPA